MAAVKYLAETTGFTTTDVTSFVIIAKVPRTAGEIAAKPPVTVVVNRGDTVFNALATAFGNAITNKRTAAQAVLTALGITS